LHRCCCCLEAAEALLVTTGAGGDHPQHVEAHSLAQGPGSTAWHSTTQRTHRQKYSREPGCAQHMWNPSTPLLLLPPLCCAAAKSTSRPAVAAPAWMYCQAAHLHWPMTTVSPSRQRKAGERCALMLVWRFSYLRGEQQ
jgi:hypothetical protein